MSSAGFHEEAWQDLGDRGGESAVLAYMFECIVCRVPRGHWDVS